MIMAIIAEKRFRLFELIYLINRIVITLKLHISTLCFLILTFECLILTEN